MDSESDPALTIQERRDGEAYFLEASGEVDLTTERLLFDPLMAAARDPDIWPVTIDLSRVLFIDTSGLAVLLIANKTLTKRLRRLRVVLSPGGQVDRALRLSGLADVIDIASAPGPPSVGMAADEADHSET